MRTTTLSFVTSLFALFVLLLSSTGSKADVYNRATSSGAYKLFGSTNNTAVSANAYYNYTTATNLTQVWGTVSVSSNTLSASAGVLTNNCYTIPLAGVLYNHAVITSKAFSFYYVVGKTYCSCHLVVELTQYGSNGQAGFKIIRNSDSKVLAQSILGASTDSGVTGADGLPGVYTEVPFISGQVTITL